jgi:hypothetical protein
MVVEAGETENPFGATDVIVNVALLSPVTVIDSVFETVPLLLRI